MINIEEKITGPQCVKILNNQQTTEQLFNVLETC
jgi:hypothetical protein